MNLLYGLDVETPGEFMLKAQQVAGASGANFSRGMQLGQQQRQWEAEKGLRDLQLQEAQLKLDIAKMGKEKEVKIEGSIAGAMEFEMGIQQWDDRDYSEFKDWVARNPHMAGSKWYAEMEGKFAAAKKERAAAELLRERQRLQEKQAAEQSRSAGEASHQKWLEKNFDGEIEQGKTPFEAIESVQERVDALRVPRDRRFGSTDEALEWATDPNRLGKDLEENERIAIQVEVAPEKKGDPTRKVWTITTPGKLLGTVKRRKQEEDNKKKEEDDRKERLQREKEQRSANLFKFLDGLGVGKFGGPEWPSY